MNFWLSRGCRGDVSLRVVVEQFERLRRHALARYGDLVALSRRVIAGPIMIEGVSALVRVVTSPASEAVGEELLAWASAEEDALKAARASLPGAGGFTRDEVDRFVWLLGALVWCGLRAVPLSWVRSCHRVLEREYSQDAALFDRLLGALCDSGVLRAEVVRGEYLVLQHDGLLRVSRDELFVDGRPTEFFEAFTRAVCGDGAVEDEDCRLVLLLLLGLRLGDVSFFEPAHRCVVARLCAGGGLSRAVLARDLSLLLWLCAPEGGEVFGRDLVEVVRARTDVVGVLCAALAQFDAIRAVADSVEPGRELADGVVDELEGLGLLVDLEVVRTSAGVVVDRALSVDGIVAPFGPVWESCVGVLGSRGVVGGATWSSVAAVLERRGFVARARAVRAGH